jgi:hypothetical protein
VSGGGGGRGVQCPPSTLPLTAKLPSFVRDACYPLVVFRKLICLQVDLR